MTTKASYNTLSKICMGLLLTIGAGLGGWYWLRDDGYVPKPYGHPRIVLPAHDYVPLTGFPYSFEVSKHAVVVPDTSARAEPYWISIYYPDFEAEIQLTYKPVSHDLKLLREYYDDAYRLTAGHQVKAYAIQEKVLKTPQGHDVVVAELYGEIPSQIQFHTTDTAHHFLRGALYFNTATQNEYLAPIIDFIKEDITHMIHTLKWSKCPDLSSPSGN